MLRITPQAINSPDNFQPKDIVKDMTMRDFPANKKLMTKLVEVVVDILLAWWCTDLVGRVYSRGTRDSRGTRAARLVAFGTKLKRPQKP